VGIILKQNDMVFLVQRHDTDWASGYWNFPGGLLEENETLTAAAAREAYEETDVLVKPTDFILTHVLHVHANEKNTQDILGFYFLTEKWNGTAINKEPHRHCNAQWFSLNNLPANITEHAIAGLHSILSDKKYSENGW
jgi:8-oxo-dGTP pyrophosphatase MutT (NUDIX family)